MTMGLGEEWTTLRLSVRSRLVCLVLAAVVPAWIAVSFLLYTAYLEKRESISQDMLSTTRIFSTIMDQELGGVTESLRSLATSPSIASGDRAGFHAQARMALAKRSDADIILADVTGQQVVNSYLPIGSPLPKRHVPDRVRSLVETGKSSVSGHYTGAVTGRHFISVDVPVMRDGRVVFDLGMTLPVDQLLKTLALPALPPEWTATIMDSDDVVVARTRDQERHIGKQAATPVLAQHKEIAREGVFQAETEDGVPVLAGYSQSAVSGWTMLISVPKAHVMRDLWRWLSWTLGGTVLLGILGVGIALRLGDLIALSIKGLIAPATALGRGEPVTVAPLALMETREVAESLVKASELLQHREHALRESEDRYEAIVQTANEGIWLLNNDCMVIYANQAMTHRWATAGRKCWEGPNSIFCSQRTRTRRPQ